MRRKEKAREENGWRGAKFYTHEVTEAVAGRKRGMGK